MHGTAAQREKAREQADDVEEIIRGARAKAVRLRNKKEHIGLLQLVMLSTLPEYWVYQFRLVEAHRLTMLAQARAAFSC